MIDFLTFVPVRSVLVPSTLGRRRAAGRRQSTRRSRLQSDPAGFAYDKSLTSGDLAQAGFEGATQPGLESMTVADGEIRKLPHRTLIVHGREDQVIPLETSLKLLHLLDKADLSVFFHCGHWSMMERRDDFNRQVRDFFLGD